MAWRAAPNPPPRSYHPSHHGSSHHGSTSQQHGGAPLHSHGFGVHAAPNRRIPLLERVKMEIETLQNDLHLLTPEVEKQESETDALETDALEKETHALEAEEKIRQLKEEYLKYVATSAAQYNDLVTEIGAMEAEIKQNKPAARKQDCENMALAKELEDRSKELDRVRKVADETKGRTEKAFALMGNFDRELEKCSAALEAERMADLQTLAVLKREEL